MKNEWIMQPIGYIRSDFKEKFGLPRQSGRAPALRFQICFLPEISQDCFKGLENFSHIWILFGFSATSEQGWNATVRPPRLGGNKRVGVFASRSPFRPNPIGLSCGKMESIEKTDKGILLTVSGIDLLDGTPVFDIKPYIPYADRIENAVGGYAEPLKNYRLQVDFPESLLLNIPKEKREGLLECLADDPRPAYQDDPTRIYAMAFGEHTVRFQVQDNILTVISVE